MIFFELLVPATFAQVKQLFHFGYLPLGYIISSILPIQERVLMKITHFRFKALLYLLVIFSPAVATAFVLTPSPTPAAAEDYFLITVKTDNSGTSASNQFTLPTFSGETYNYCIDEDNNGIWYVTGSSSSVTCTYPSAGTYTLRIGGTFPRIYFNGSGDAQKILSVEQWGAIPWSSMENAFSGCTNLMINATDAPNLSNVTSLQGMFEFCTAFNQPIGHWNTSHVTNMAGLFYGAINFNQDISTWDTGNVTNMADMFAQAQVFNQPIGSWNTGSVTTMSQMFYAALAFDQDIATWNVEQVSNMANMLSGGRLSNAHYDALLIGWNAQNLKSNVSFHAGTSRYTSSAAVSARATMVSSSGDNWTITDGGYATATRTCTITPTATITPTMTVSPTTTPTQAQTASAIQPGEVQAFPNPAPERFNFLINLDAPAAVTISLFNPNGERVAQLQAEKPAGTSRMEWNCSNVAPGIYIARIKMGNREKTLKLAVVQ